MRPRPRLPIPALTLLALATTIGLADTAESPSPYTGERTPDGALVCAPWVHGQEHYRVTGPDGRRYRTWHPLRDEDHGCVFGHEHGSDPRAFLGFSQSGMPAFGYVAAVAGMEEELDAHSGFKVYVVNDDLRGKAWMIVLHQGSAGPRRAHVRHHSLALWLVDRRDRSLIARATLMADFGSFTPNCDGAPRQVPQRLIPHPGCASPYEAWTAAVDVGGVLRATPTFDMENATTRADLTDPTSVEPNSPDACGPHDPFGWNSYCKGDRRSITHPRWLVRNRLPVETFHTDVFGRLVAGPGRQTVVQFVRREVLIDDEDAAGGTFTYVMQDRGTGVYLPRPLARPPYEAVGFDGPEPSVRWPN